MHPGLMVVTGLLALTGLAAHAQTAQAVFKDADLALGQKLIAEHKCAECHVRKVGGDGSAIYKPQGRINTPGFLRGMAYWLGGELDKRVVRYGVDVTL